MPARSQAVGYPFWSGELFNRGRASAAERVEIDISHNALAGGLLCADGQWRQIVTIEDALKGGCTLFDIEQLKRENSADDFKNLFMCEFVDDKASVFPFEELQRCMVDTLEEWEDYAPFSQQDFSRFVLDFLVFGNAFLEKRYSTTGKVIRLETSPAKYTRRGVEEDVYWWVPSFNEPTAFAPGSVFHLLEPDINQELYGLPEYLSALNSAWLNESATLFRRKYYENGAHAGYIMYVTDAVQDRNDIEMLRENMVKSKGRNNFKNLFLYAPQGKADGIKIIPLSEVATKDDFFNIKKASAADLLDAHRIPFQLMGGKPENVGSLGDIEKVAKVFVRNELIPLQDRIREINGWLGQEVIRFKDYSLESN
ncbi:hypothetical protein VEE42_00040 [Escherichia coli]|nr:hypothetical protein VEE42_00040 [Escherichia coli]